MTDFSTIHAAADARGGTPEDQALASVAAWQRVHGSVTRMLLGLSAVGTGLQQIEHGKVESGVTCARAGLEFLRRELGQ